MSGLALQLIAENKRSRATFLDLGNCGLTEVPAEVGELVWLESLSLASEWYEWDGREWQEKKSRNTGDKNNRLIDIGPLGGLTRLRSVIVTQVADLAPLAGLTKLQMLGIGDATGCDLTPLANLTALQELLVLGVTDLAPLAKLSSLQTLGCQATQVTDISPLAGMTALQTLNVSGTRVSDLAPLAGPVGPANARCLGHAGQRPGAAGWACRPCKRSMSRARRSATWRRWLGLSALQTLNVWGTQVSDLAPLAGLSALQTLDVSGTQVSDLAPLAGLVEPAAERSGCLRRTQVTDLAPLAGLSALQTLNVSGTQVTDLAPLAGLSALQTLDVSGTQVTDLSALVPLISRGCPVRWSSESWRGHGIYVQDCPLTNPPPEIVNQGNDAILNYFRERALGEVDHLYEAKMLILGEGGAGKTSLLRRLYQPDQPLPTEKETTKGIAIYRHEFTLRNGRRFHLNVWDFGGQEIYHATHQFFLTRRSLYLLVDDTRKDHKSVSDEGFKYWLELIDVFGGHSPVLIFQNEKGGRSKAIDIGGIKGRYDNVKERYAGNLEHGHAADQVRDGIEFFASNLSHIGEELPARWLKVRADIEVRASEAPYISQQEYFHIYSRHMDFDRSKALHLSQYLHDLGVFLHFQDDPLLARTVILQNQWATEAVFRILDDETVKAQLGRFNSTDCERLWRDSVYADMHPELLALMQRFELCYELQDSKPPTWLAPQLLPPAKPQELADWGKPEDLVLRYRYDFLPKG